MTIFEIIPFARKVLDQEPELAVYMIRDYPATKEAGLGELAWDMAREGCTKGEAQWLLDKLEHYLEARQ